MKRVKCFVDGFNLYHAVADLKINHLKWLNLRQLAQAFIKPTQEVLDAVFYFSAYPTWLEGSYRRHQTYVKALEAMGVTAVIGHFKEKQKKCLKCGVKWCAHEEKQSDVNHAMSKQLDLGDLKSHLPNLHKIFKDLKSEIKDVIADEDRIAFRVEQKAMFYKHKPNGVQVRLDSMNLYKLESGKVKEWQIWVNITEV